MAGGQERILRGRIKSVQATKKITRAMELIAASRIVRAQQRVQAAVPYSETITEVVRDLAAAGGAEVGGPFLVGRDPVRKACHVVIAADRGLCGGYNASVFRAAEGEIKKDALAGIDYSLITVGRKGENYFKFRGYRVDAMFGGFSDNPTYEHARSIADTMTDLYLSGEVDRVQLIYTRFVSAGFQEVVQRPLVPLDAAVVEGGDGRAGTLEGVAGASYEFEPNAQVILQALLPRYVEARMYAALLNAAASEHAARQRAMKSATDNAEELIRTLTRVMNRARQDAITTEIMEIVGGAEALKGGGGGSRRRPAVVEPAPTATSASPAPSAPVATAVADDLTRIEGIGPKVAKALEAAGITTFDRLAAASEAELSAALEAAGLRFTPSMPTWAKQAAFLVAGDEAGFRAYTDTLVAGREPDAE